jgi:hypothetical protein
MAGQHLQIIGADSAGVATMTGFDLIRDIPKEF